MDDSALPGPGDIVAGKYRIEREIGRGGMSVVFGASHEVTSKRFAIKWLMPDEEGVIRAEAAQRFIREAQVAGRFHHPNVVEVYDVGDVAGSYYMVMEWLEGESLAERLDERGPFSFSETCRYMIPCMNAIDEAHQAGIVHRDLKPANIFVCHATKHGPEHMKVLDFGIAKLETRANDIDPRVTKTGVLIGTPYYLSLEQLRSEPVDQRTDIYAFGVMLYQLLSGELPFPADNFGELVLQIATGTPAPIRSLVPNLPAGAAELVQRAMARNPADRFQDLRGLIALMERINSETRAARKTLAGSPSHPSLQTPLATESKIVPPAAARDPEPAPSFTRTYAAIAAVTLVAIAWLLHGYYTRQPLAERPLPQPAAASQLENAGAAVGKLPGATLPSPMPSPHTQAAAEPFVPPPPQAAPTPPPVVNEPQLSADTGARTPIAPSSAASRLKPPTAARAQARASAPAQSIPQPPAAPADKNEEITDPAPPAEEAAHNPLHMRIQ